MMRLIMIMMRLMRMMMMKMMSNETEDDGACDDNKDCNIVNNDNDEKKEVKIEQ